MLEDIHDINDNRKLRVDSVGIVDYKIPVIFEGKYPTMAMFKVGVSLEENKKGAHLSRIIQQIDTMFAYNDLKIKDLTEKLKLMKRIVEADDIYLSVDFDISLPIITPVSSLKSYITPVINLKENHVRNEIIKEISISVLGTMLCPSSKFISLYGAHSQKCLVKTTLSGNIEDIIIEDVVRLIRSLFSAEVYGVVKREDEKYLTEYAYNNPKFSEDLIRDVLTKLKEKYNFCRIEAELKNYESIHEHNVYARGSIL